MPSGRSSAYRVVGYLAAGLLVLVLGIWMGGHPSWLPSSLRSTFVETRDGRLVNEAIDIITRDYYRPVNRTQLINKGLAAAIDESRRPVLALLRPDRLPVVPEHNPTRT